MRPALLLLLALAACATPGAPTPAAGSAPAASPNAGLPAPLAVVAAMPQQLPFFRRAEAPTDYAQASGQGSGQASGQSGLGASVRYLGTQGLPGIATVYVYDRGQVLPVEGADNPAVAQELDRSAAEVVAFAGSARLRDLQVVALRSPGGTPDPVLPAGPATGPGSIRCRVFTASLPTGEKIAEAVCLTVRRQRFLKTRLTIRDGAGMAQMVAAGLVDEVMPLAR